MASKHIVELLVEANKQISSIATQVENQNSLDKKIIINKVNDVIRQLDVVVEQLEK